MPARQSEPWVNQKKKIHFYCLHNVQDGSQDIQSRRNVKEVAMPLREVAF